MPSHAALRGCAAFSPFRRCSSITDRCGYAHSSRLGKTKNRQQRGMAAYFNRLLTRRRISGQVVNCAPIAGRHLSRCRFPWAGTPLVIGCFVSAPEKVPDA